MPIHPAALVRNVSSLAALDAEHDLPAPEHVQFAARAVGSDVGFDRPERFSRRHRKDRGDGKGRHSVPGRRRGHDWRLQVTALCSCCAPGGVAAHAGDAQLGCKAKMFFDLIRIHQHSSD